MAEAVAASGGLVPLWRLLGSAGRPLLWALLAARARRGKEISARLAERRGHASVARPAGPVVWVHAASVGEAGAVLPLIERLCAGGLAIVFTTGTVTAAAIAAERLPAGAVHQFVPLDVAPYVRRFLDFWRPGAAIFVESELWPVALDETGRRGIPRIVVNGRLSARSFRRWQRLPATAAALFGRLTLCLAQSDEDADRFAGLGAADVRSAGNLKVDVPAPAADAATLAALEAEVGGRPRWLAVSTHAGEEEVVAEAHAALAARRPGILTIIVPRHSSRGRAVAEALARRGLIAALRSRGEAITAATTVYVADTMGEVGLFYRLAPVTFVGGSITVPGGHNPIEPVLLGSAVVSGRRVENFRSLYADLAAAGGARLVDDAAELAAAVAALLDDPVAARRQRQAAATVAAGHAGALERSLTLLMPLLAPLVAAPSGGRVPDDAAPARRPA